MKRLRKIEKAGCCIRSGRKILLIKGYSGLWGFPKGTVENGENVYNCAIREVLEETGVKVPYLGEAFVYIDCIIFMVDMHTPDVVIDGNEVVDYKWVHIYETEDLP